MDYTLLRSFHAVAREDSFTAAARALNLSQSTLSTQVKAWRPATASSCSTATDGASN